MLPQIKDDILAVIDKAMDALSSQDFISLSELSNHTIHDASIYQEDDPLTLAVVMYALSKVIQRSMEQGQTPPAPVAMLKRARNALSDNDDNSYRAAIKQLLRTIVSQDSQLKLYIQDVIQKAKIKKATKMHEHGISIARTAELLGISQWELQEYVGQSARDGFDDERALKRLSQARLALKDSTIVFDTGPIISLTTNNLLWTLEHIKTAFATNMALPVGVKHELVDKPLETRRFKFEAIQVQRLLERNVFAIVPEANIRGRALDLLQLANSLLSFKGKPIQIVQQGEMETLACAIEYRAFAVVIDERITRLLIENPFALKNLMERRLHLSLNIDMRVLKKLKQELSRLIVFRSIELVALAFEAGILDSLIVHIPHAKRELLESVLWGVKLSGCAVSEDEINALVKKLAV
ncbi:MAG TPA: hypothetical protein VJJ82_00630 [Candidatus Nanoarchaeia archaeon]|nr:hypothetical protein [Candidatus Nanoarchaeia archaeon]